MTRKEWRGIDVCKECESLRMDPSECGKVLLYVKREEILVLKTYVGRFVDGPTALSSSLSSQCNCARIPLFWWSVNKEMSFQVNFVLARGRQWTSMSALHRSHAVRPIAERVSDKSFNFINVSVCIHSTHLPM